jgi:TonB family protein
MRQLVFSALFLAAFAPHSGQTAPGTEPSPPHDPRALLEAAIPLYDFSSPDLKPWHLKATYQLYDPKGQPTEQGTWEYWWSSPHVHRSTLTRAGEEHTEWSTAEGAIYRKGAGRPSHYFERMIKDIVFITLPTHSVLDSDKVKLELKMVPPDKPELACVVVTGQALADGKPQPQGSGNPTDYCFNPATTALRIFYSDQITRRYNRVVKTQDHFLPREVVVAEGSQTLFTVSVDTIDSIDTDSAALRPTSDATLEQQLPHPADTNGSIGVGMLVKKIAPVYPASSKTAHEEGVVTLAALIGKDGRIDDLEVLGSPSPALAKAALDAVKQWEYEPYLLNGQPVEVETTVNVIFTLGR